MVGFLAQLQDTFVVGRGFVTTVMFVVGVDWDVVPMGSNAVLRNVVLLNSQMDLN
jgi:hypothetical protein